MGKNAGKSLGMRQEGEAAVQRPHCRFSTTERKMLKRVQEVGLVACTPSIK